MVARGAGAAVSLMMHGQGPGGRAWAGLLGAGFLVGGMLLLGRQLGWWSVDLGLIGAGALLLLGAGFLAAALGKRAWPERADAEGDAWCGPWAGHGGRRVGMYWMVVTAGFFVVAAYLLAARSFGWPSPGWAIAGPYWLLAVGGMFLLRLAAWREEPEQPAAP